jgi:hypothetical protein
MGASVCVCVCVFVCVRARVCMLICMYPSLCACVSMCAYRHVVLAQVHGKTRCSHGHVHAFQQIERLGCRQTVPVTVVPHPHAEKDRRTSTRR